MQHRRLAGSAIRAALPPLQNLPPLIPRDQLPSWQVDFDVNGRPYLAVVRARNSEAATEEARCELAVQCPDFDNDQARVVGCRQVM